MAKLIINGQSFLACVNHDPECRDIIKYTHTVYTYREYIKSFDWLRCERKYPLPLILTRINYKNEIENDCYTFIFVCKVEYETFCYRPLDWSIERKQL